MQRMGTTTHGAVTSTSYSHLGLGGAGQRLGSGRNVGSCQNSSFTPSMGVPTPAATQRPQKGSKVRMRPLCSGVLRF